MTEINYPSEKTYFIGHNENDDNGELKSKEYSTYQEAEQECLIKLIEIVKNR